MSLASIVFAPKLDIRANRWSSSFNLVVGNSFADRVMFWNGRLLIPDWLDTDLCCLRIEPEQLDDPTFLKVLDTLIKRRNHVNGGSGGQPQVTLRSASLTAKQLEDARDVLSSMRPWSVMMTQHLTALNEIVPPGQALQDARESNRFGGGLFPLPDWTKFVWSPPTVRPPVIAPDHLSDAPARQLFTQGYWCADFLFEYDGVGPRFAQQNQWELPRRWRMAGAFKTSLAAESSFGRTPSPRRSRERKLAVFLSADHPIDSIHVPSANEAIRQALVADSAWQDPTAEHGRISPPSKAQWTQPSNEARYLTGVLGMTGGLRRASNFLLHPFLQQTFAKLGGTPNVTPDKVVPTVSRLQKRAPREPTFDLHSERERQALGVLIIKAAQTLKDPMDYIRYDDLKSEWKAYREAYWAANPRPSQPDASVNWEAHEDRSMESCFVEMRRRHIVFQGHQWTCGACHHKNWVDLSALSSEMSCEVCARSEQAPVDIRWLFRPNEFLIESLRDHSVLSLVWLLTMLCWEARRSFMFVGPTWFGFGQEDDPEAEADLLVVVDGKALLCEAKSSWSRLRAAHVEKLVDLAIRLRPDVALLGIMQAGAGLTKELEAAKARLSAEKIEFRLVTPSVRSLEDGPYLHFD